MRTTVLALAGAGVLGLAACENLTPDQQLAVGGLGGATAGLITAELFEADDNWRLISALGGATAGVLVAQNQATRQCAYARGDGTYFVAACPT